MNTSRDRRGHLELRRPRLEAVERARQRAAGREDGVDGGLQRGRLGPSRSRFGVQRELPAQRLDFGPHATDTAPRRPGDASTRAMNSPMRSISGSRMPRLVIAGVPMRMPLATMGGF